jgi:hypothetical protein
MFVILASHLLHLPLGKAPDPDLDLEPALFLCDLQDAYYLSKVHLHHSSKIKSHKEVTKL